MEKAPEKAIVNPIALQNCVVKYADQKATVLDISFLRIVVEEQTPWELPPPEESFEISLQLERNHFAAVVNAKARGQGWIRFEFAKILPSAAAHLRSFLSPKKVGESLQEDWRTEQLRHFHGLNESELWFDEAGGVLFTYLDPANPTQQFLIRMKDAKAALRVGRLSRREYMELASIENELNLQTLSDRETYAKLGECRDIVTNFRPNGQTEYHLKQRLLKVVSDHLYSTSHRVDMIPPRPQRIVSLPAEG